MNESVPRVLSPGEPSVVVVTPAALGAFPVGAASFGPPLASPGLTGDVALGQDETGNVGDACEPTTSDVSGKVALIDRGTCAFVIKVKNAQTAGAIAVLIADNVAGSPPAGLGGTDPTITIPSGRITLSDGNAVKANLGTGVRVNIGLDLSILAGTDR